MSLFLRFVLPLLAVLAVLAGGVTPMVSGLMERWFRGDVETRSQLVYASMRDQAAALAARHDDAGLDALFRAIVEDEHLLGAGLCGSGDRPAHRSSAWPAGLRCPSGPTSDRALSVAQLATGPALISAFPLTDRGDSLGTVVIVQDLRFIARRSNNAILLLAGLLTLVGACAAVVTLVVGRITLRGWIRTIRTDLANRIEGGAETGPVSSGRPPLTSEMRKLLLDFDQSRAPAETNIRVDWTPDSLRGVLRGEMPDAEVLVVSNREPYIHTRIDGEIHLQRPASGLVTALEPVMRACGGTWIAHGSGEADRDTVDDDDRLAVPPEAPAYTLRRIWLSEAEQEGYYYGFANEGLWPLCHIAFVRPAFRTSDWEQYQSVNRKFANAVAAEAKTTNPVVLVQDYHFALLPRMVRELLPEATIITFWHIPWPNPEVLSICPWKEEILSGLLGSSILGFHTQFHCLNFLESTDRFLECHLDREHSILRMAGNATLIRPYPISIEWPPSALTVQPPVGACREAIRRRYGLPPDCPLAVGVERFDYTKGIVDRFRAVESLLEAHPEWLGRLVLLQVAAPTRGSLAAYRDVQAEAQAVAEGINGRLGREGWQPIILVPRHHEPEEVFTLFRAADVCLVSSLHDGMNLVAKEFVAARDDEDGVLVLSTFAGASRELQEALIVNPYDVQAMGEAIHAALSMPPCQRRDRMHLMRAMVSEHNIFHWAARMLLDASRMRKRRQIEGQAASTASPAAGERS
jgi:trehalose 6-phosphate synthase